MQTEVQLLAIAQNTLQEIFLSYNDPLEQAEVVREERNLLSGCKREASFS